MLEIVDPPPGASDTEERVMTVTMVFINLPVTDLERSKRFFTGIGFRIEERFTSEDAACVVFGEAAFAMLHTPESHARYDPRPLADTALTATGIYALGLATRAEVDEIADRVLGAGGSAAREPEDHGLMYVRSFHDPDGHLWELAWMDPAMAEGDGPVG